MAHALAPTAARASSCSSAATSCRRSPRTGDPRRSGSTCATARRERWLDAAAGVPAVHALRRRRQHQVLGQRALPPAPRGLRGDRARRRRLAGLADRLRHARRRTTTAPSGCTTCTGEHGSIRPSRRAGRSLRAGAACAAWPRSSRRLRARAAPVAAAARPHRPGRARRLRPVQHVQLVPLPLRRQERRRGVLRRPALARPNVTLWTNALRAAAAHRRVGRRVDRVEVERDGERVVVEAPPSWSRAAPSTRRRCCCGRRQRPPARLANSSGLVGRRYMAHLATMMQGFHPFRRTTRCSRRRWRSTTSTSAARTRTVPARPDPVAGAHARRDGADRRAVDSRCGRTTRGWRAASTGWPCRRTCPRTTTA
jgi:hypothetical protein